MEDDPNQILIGEGDVPLAMRLPVNLGGSASAGWSNTAWAQPWGSGVARINGYQLNGRTLILTLTGACLSRTALTSGQFAQVRLYDLTNSQALGNVITIDSTTPTLYAVRNIEVPLQRHQRDVAGARGWKLAQRGGVEYEAGLRGHVMMRLRWMLVGILVAAVLSVGGVVWTQGAELFGASLDLDGILTWNGEALDAPNTGDASNRTFIRGDGTWSPVGLQDAAHAILTDDMSTMSSTYQTILSADVTVGEAGDAVLVDLTAQLGWMGAALYVVDTSGSELWRLDNPMALAVLGRGVPKRPHHPERPHLARRGALRGG